MQKTALFSDRLKLAVKSAGGADPIAKASGIPRRTLETYLSGQTEPKVSKILSLAESCGVSVTWLMTGKGDPNNIDLSASIGEIAYDDAWSAIPLIDSQPLVMAVDAQKIAVHEQDVPDKLQSFRLLTRIKFRRPSLLKFGLDPAAVVAVRVAGNAMSPLILDDDSVLLDTRMSSLRADDTHVFVIGSQLLVRRLQFLPDDRVLLTADHPHIAPIELRSQAAAREVWIGKVVWVARWLISA